MEAPLFITSDADERLNWSTRAELSKSYLN